MSGGFFGEVNMASEDAPVDLTANHNGEIISIAVIFTLLSLLAMIARVTSRAMTKTSFGADDYFLIASWILAFAETVALAAGTHFAKLGYHLQALSTENVVALGKLTYATSIVQSASFVLSKLSILILFHRIFITRGFRITVYVLMGVTAAWWIGAFFASAFICYPASRIWDSNMPGSCGNQTLLNIIEPIPWILTDFAMLIAPIPVIRQLQLTKARKWRIYAIFMLGGLTSIISVVRYVEILYVGRDTSWTSAGLADLQIIEAHVSITCAALIASKPALAWISPANLRSGLQSLGSSNSSKHSVPSYEALWSPAGSEKRRPSPHNSLHQELEAPRIMVERSLERTVEPVRRPLQPTEIMDAHNYR